MASIPPWLRRATPRAAARTRILTAALFWSAAGLFLVARGAGFLLAEPLPALAGTLAVATALGVAKSRFVFDPTARRALAHIRRKPEPACLGGFLSLRNWGLVLAMMGLGRLVGMAPVPAAVRGGVLTLVGVGLMRSSRLLWQAWRATPATPLGDLRQAPR